MIVSTYTAETVAKYGYEEGYKRIREAGFKGVDWSLGRVWGIRATTAAGKLPDDCILLQDIEIIKEKYRPELECIKKNGLEIVQAHAPIAVFFKHNPEFEEQITKANINMIKMCEYAGAPLLVIHTPSEAVDDPDITYKEIWNATIARLSALIPTLKETGVKVLLENTFDRESHKMAGKTRLFVTGACCDPYEVCEIIDTLNAMAGQECFGFCLDTGHLNCVRRRFRPYIDIIGDRLKALHIHDSNGCEDDHFVPEMGTIDWNDFTEGLKAIKYRGAINFERDPDPYMNDLVKVGESFIERILND